MAIKITGTTVINDTRGVENIVDINRLIKKPEIISPTDGGTDVALNVNIQGSTYSPLYAADTRDYREFQVDLATGDFSTPERSNQIDSDSWSIDPILDPDESYKVRIRDVSVNGTVSEWSEEVAFTSINIFVDEPTVSVEDGPSDVPENPVISTSAFSVTNGSDTHESTDWEVIRTSDSTVVFESLNDTVNLTSITVTTSLDESEEYEFRARHRGTTFGTSSYGSVTATTLASFAPTTLGQSFEGGFYMGTIAAAGTTYYLLVAPNATGCACCQWKTSNTSTSGTCSLVDGYANTYPALENSTHPAGNWTATSTYQRLMNLRCSTITAPAQGQVIHYRPEKILPLTTIGRVQRPLPLSPVPCPSTVAIATASPRIPRSEFVQSAGYLFNLFTYLINKLII
jgi:hypothetical protein